MKFIDSLQMSRKQTREASAWLRNMNPQLGRIFRRKFPPRRSGVGAIIAAANQQRPRSIGGPLGDMLGPLGMLAGL